MARKLVIGEILERIPIPPVGFYYRRHNFGKDWKKGEGHMIVQPIKRHLRRNDSTSFATTKLRVADYIEETEL